MNKVAISYAPSEQQFLPVAPLGIAVLSEYLKENNIENDVIDLELELWLLQGMKSSEYASKDANHIDIENLPTVLLVDKLRDYEILTFSLMGKRQIPYLLSIVKHLKAAKTRLKYVIVGGAFFNEKNAREIIKDYGEYVNYAIVGEGWGPMLSLVSNLLKDNLVYDVSGVACKNQDGEVIYNKSEKWKGELPIPNYATINLDGYIKQQEKLYGFHDPNIIYHVLVGDRHCPYNCSFCRISNNTEKVKSSKEIAEEMIELHKRVGAKRFSLICNEMNPTEAYLKEYMDQLATYHERLDWFCYFRPNKLSFETLKRARELGCVLIRYGTETGSQRIMDHMNKKLYVDEMEQIMRDTHRAGIWNHINIVTGYLHETEEDIQMTLDFLERNKEYIDSVRINPFYVPIGSPIHKNPEKYGIKIIRNTGSYIEFQEPGCSWEEKQKRVAEATGRILEKCMDLEIGFAGILPFLVANTISHFDNVAKAKQWLKANHAYLWSPISPDTAKWSLAHPERKDVSINGWDQIAGKRGANYQTLMEMNND